MPFTLVLVALAVFAVVPLLRRWTANKKMKPLGRRSEAFIRVGLCLLCATIVFLVFGGTAKIGIWAGFNVLTNALLIYGVTHLADRILLHED